MKSLIIFLSVMHLFQAAVCHADTDYEQAIIGTWEYRQAAGKGFDKQGEILRITRNNGRIQGVYYGLEREGEHGLFYTAVEMKGLIVKDNGEVIFTVPERNLFTKRPDRAQRMELEKSRSAGFTRDELQMKGRLQVDKLILNCTSESRSCPEAVMVFQKGKWGAN